MCIPKSVVISLRTSGKRLPGKKLAIYVGVVIAVLVLSYNLTRNLSFIVVSDKEGVFEFILNQSIKPFTYSFKGLYGVGK